MPTINAHSAPLPLCVPPVSAPRTEGPARLPARISRLPGDQLRISVRLRDSPVLAGSPPVLAHTHNVTHLPLAALSTRAGGSPAAVCTQLCTMISEITSFSALPHRSAPLACCAATPLCRTTAHIPARSRTRHLATSALTALTHPGRDLVSFRSRTADPHHTCAGVPDALPLPHCLTVGLVALTHCQQNSALHAITTFTRMPRVHAIWFALRLRTLRTCLLRTHSLSCAHYCRISYQHRCAHARFSFLVLSLTRLDDYWCRTALRTPVDSAASLLHCR